MIKITPISKGKIKFNPVIVKQDINVQPTTQVINENYTQSEVDAMFRAVDEILDEINGEVI